MQATTQTQGLAFTKPPRRKRKMHHDPSSLLRATIQEYGVYDKEVDGFKTKFVDLFRFLESWQRAAMRQERSQVQILQASSMDGGEAYDHRTQCWTDSKNRSLPSPTGLGLSPFGPGPVTGRDLCLEEELQVRLGRLTAIARTLRYLCNKERDQKLVLYKDAVDCKQKCLELLNNLIQHFHKETGSLQSQLTAMERNNEDLEKESRALRMAYDDMVNHAAKTVEMLETDLEKAEQEVIDLTKELRSLEDVYSSMEEENTSFREEAEELHSEIEQLKDNNTKLEKEAKASDMAREHFEVLLEIALSKLRIYEEGEDPRKVKPGQVRSRDSKPRVALSLQLLPETPENRSRDSTPHDVRPRRLMADSVSITSFETTFSELSLPIIDSHRSYSMSEDRISNISQSGSITGMSPSAPPRKKNKKRSFFGKPFNLMKSISVDSQISKAVSSDRLPTITDERSDSKLSLAESRSAAGSRVSLSEYYSAAENSPIVRDILASADDHFEDGGLDETEVATGKQTRGFLADDEDDMITSEDPDIQTTGKDRKKSEKAKSTKQKHSKKVQRTASFGALGKGGLVALAKDIEKRFRKKRRSKTADFSELNRIGDKENAALKKKIKDDSLF